jgi:hypothetical protein
MSTPQKGRDGFHRYLYLYEYAVGWRNASGAGVLEVFGSSYLCKFTEAVIAGRFGTKPQLTRSEQQSVIAPIVRS